MYCYCLQCQYCIIVIMTLCFKCQHKGTEMQYWTSTCKQSRCDILVIPQATLSSTHAYIHLTFSGYLTTLFQLHHSYRDSRHSLNDWHSWNWWPVWRWPNHITQHKPQVQPAASSMCNRKSWRNRCEVVHLFVIYLILLSAAQTI